MGEEWLTDIPEKWYTLEGHPEVMYGLILSKNESQYRFFLIRELFEVYVNEGHHEYINVVAKSKNIFLHDTAQFVNICQLLKQGLSDNKVILEEIEDTKGSKKKVIKLDCCKNKNVIFDWRFDLSVANNSQLVLRDLLFQQFNIAQKLIREQKVLLKVINLKDGIISRFLENKDYLPINLQNYIKKCESTSCSDDRANGRTTNMLEKFDFEKDIIPLTLNSKRSSIWDVVSDLVMQDKTIWKNSNIYNPEVLKKSYVDSKNKNKYDNVHNTNIIDVKTQFDLSNSSFSDLDDGKNIQINGESKQDKRLDIEKVEERQTKFFVPDSQRYAKNTIKSENETSSSENTPKKKRTILGNSSVKHKKLKK